MSKKIVITTGGTGGHVYPALGLAQQLIKASPSNKVIFIGGGLMTNRYFNRATFPFHEVSCKTLAFSKPWTFLRNSFAILKGIKQSYHLLKAIKPDVVVGFGSYHTFPTLIAAKMLSLPIVLHEANSIPGRVQRLMSPYVNMTALHFPDTAAYLKGASIEVGMPLREGFTRSDITKKESLKYFNLDARTPIVLVFGGSQGAQAINRLFLEAAGTKAFACVQVIHLTGDLSLVKEAETLYQRMGIRACVKAYETCMNHAWNAADLFIARAGASSIAEAMEFEVPGILIPYPSATDNHQEKNADFMVHTVGGAVKLIEKELNSLRLNDELNRFLVDDCCSLKNKQDAIQKYKQRPFQKDLCSLVLSI